MAYCILAHDEVQPIFYYGGGINKKILKKIYAQIDVMSSYYSRVTVTIIQLHQAYFTYDNSLLSRFLQHFRRELKKRTRYGNRVGYIWVREQARADTQHYHIAFLLDGHHCKSAHIVSEITEEIWMTISGKNFSYRVKNRVYRISKTEEGERTLRAARMRLSYFAKNDTKKTHKHINSYGVSRLKVNPHAVTLRGPNSARVALE